MDPVRVVAGGDKELARNVRSDSERAHKSWGGVLHKLLQVSGVDLDLLVQLEPAPRERGEDVAHRTLRVRQVALGLEGSAGENELGDHR